MRAAAAGRMTEHIQLDRRTFRELRVFADARRTNLVRPENRPHVLEDLSAHLAPQVVARQQVAARQTPLEHRFQRIQRTLDFPGPLQRQVVGRHRDQQQVAREDRVERQYVEQRTTVDHHRHRRQRVRVQRQAQPRDDVDALAEQRVDLRQVEMCRTQHHAALRDAGDLVEWPLADEKAVDRVLGKTRLHAEYVRQVRLRVEVDAQWPCAAQRDGRQQVERSGRLADATFLVEYRDDRHGTNAGLRKWRGYTSTRTGCVALAPVLSGEQEKKAIARFPLSLRSRIMRALAGPCIGVSNSLIQFVILAAGEGKRMRSALPKMLHPLAGLPLVEHAIGAARSTNPAAIALVVGHGAGQLREALAHDELTFVHQQPPRGTGDAVRAALAVLPHDGVTIVANGDCPLIAGETYAALAGIAAHGKLALLTARVADPRGLGRVLRGDDGCVSAIVEDRDATIAQRAQHEIYTGALAAPSALLAAWVAKLTPHNAQGEFYLTDIVGLALADGVQVNALAAADADDAMGVNDRVQLAAVERVVQRRRAAALMAAGTTIADPARIDIRGTLGAAADTYIDVGCVFEGDVSVATGVHVEAHCVLRNLS